MKCASITKHLVVATLITYGALPCRAAVDFSFNFVDAPGVGFNASGQVGADRRAAMQQAGDYVASFFINYNATIEIEVDGSATGQTWLASASSAYYGQFLNPVTSPGYYDVGDVMIKILGGNAADPSPNIDGYVNWNFEGIDWFTGVTYNPGEIDMVSTAIHEIVHTLAFRLQS